MQLTFATDPRSVRTNLPLFVALAGERLWNKRIAHLRRELGSSPFRAKVAGDYHWLETELSEQLQPVSTASEPPIPLDALAAMHFAQTVVAVHQRLTFAGKASLEGRIRDCLQATSGFASLYAEMDVARRLFDFGYDVEFSDLEGTARYDLRFAKGAAEGEVECKSLSADAGRKIHRRDFYRFMESLGPAIVDRINTGAKETILVTVNDRLPSDDHSQQLLRAATLGVLADAKAPEHNGSFFAVVRQPSRVPPETATLNSDAIYQTFKSEYGDYCHVSGAIVEGANCLAG
jgi:hypothetical protein